MMMTVWGLMSPEAADGVFGTGIYSVRRLANLTEGADSVGLIGGDFGR